jgi:hypothetical protein
MTSYDYLRFSFNRYGAYIYSPDPAIIESLIATIKPRNLTLKLEDRGNELKIFEWGYVMVEKEGGKKEKEYNFFGDDLFKLLLALGWEIFSVTTNYSTEEPYHSQPRNERLLENYHLRKEQA